MSVRFFVVLLSAAVCAAAAADEAAAQVAVVSDIVQERTSAPGQSYTGAIVVRNTTPRPQEVKAYLSDYAFTAEGATHYADPGAGPRSSARWITLTPSRITIPAGGQEEIAFRVDVPADGSASAGTYWSMVLVEPIADGSAESAHRRPDDRAGMGVRTRLRFGVQVATHLGESGARSVRFAAARAVAGPDGARVLELDLVNVGERAYRPVVRLELFDANGNPAGRFEAERGLLYPGTSLRQRFSLGALPSGAYQALVVADTGGDNVFGARYDLAL